MKKTIRRIAFSFRFAFKNLVRFRLRSILFIFSFIVLFVTLLMGFSTKAYVVSYYYGAAENTYREIDFSMGTSLNSNLRFFSIRPIVEDQNMANYVDDAIPFFEMDTLASINGEKLYVKTMASYLDQFKKVSNTVHIISDNLSDHDVIITKSMADQYDLSVGENLSLYLGTMTKAFTVVDIVDDGGLFQDDTIYINKDGSLSFFLTALNPALAAINPILLHNMYNQVYFEVKDGVSFEDAMNYVSSIPEFSSLNFHISIDTNALDQYVRRTVSFFDLIIIITFFVVLLVMQTTFMLYFQEKKKSFAVVELLGGKRRFSFGIIFIEISFFFVLSLISSVFIGNAIIRNGLKYVGSPSTYQLEFSTILWSALIMVFLYVFTSLYYFISTSRTSSIKQTLSMGVEKKIKLLPMVLLILSSFALYMLGYLHFSSDWINQYKPILQTISIFVLLFSTAFFLIALSSKGQSIRKKPMIFALQFKILLAKRAFYQYLSVMLVCFLSILLLTLANAHMATRMNTYSSEFKIDFVLTNFISRYDDTYQEISINPDVSSVDEVGYLQNVGFTDFAQNLNSLIAIDPNQIETYFNLDISETALANLSRVDRHIILLPERFQMLYHMQVGDFVHLNISPLHNNESFEIGGFFEKQVGDLAFVNLQAFSIYDDISHNALFVNAQSDPYVLKTQLINDYSKYMVYVIDFEQVVTDKMSEMRMTTNYLTLILSAIIGCFILSVFNHSFLLLGQMKESYARLYVLGFSKKRMLKVLVKESIILFVLMTIASVISFVFLSKIITPLILLSGEYENVNLTLPVLLKGELIILFVYILTKIIYFFGVWRIHPSEVVKTY